MVLSCVYSPNPCWIQIQCLQFAELVAPESSKETYVLRLAYGGLSWIESGLRFGFDLELHEPVSPAAYRNA